MLAENSVSHVLKYLQLFFPSESAVIIDKSNDVKEIRLAIIHILKSLIVYSFEALRCSYFLAHNLQSSYYDLIDCREAFGQRAADELVVVHERLLESDSEPAALALTVVAVVLAAEQIGL